MLKRNISAVLLILVLFVFAGCVKTTIPSPVNMGEAPHPCVGPEEILGYFEGIPYRGDGSINRYGSFTLFAKPDKFFTDPGLNCSGFTVGASRFFFARNFNLADMTIDRLADSGPDSPYGEDWDFGYDLILNVTEGMERKVMLPYGQSAEIAGSNGMDLRGFDLHDREAWADVISRMTPGHIYLFSMSKPVAFKNYSLLHSHVGLIVPDGKGHIWLCHATQKGGVNKVDISNADNLEPILKANPGTPIGPRKILIIEAPRRNMYRLSAVK